MKHIKSYKIFESIDLELEKELKRFKITDYILNENGSIDCNQSVNLTGHELNNIPFDFNKINGNFDINDNNLTSLKNCPKHISGWFGCSYNKLTSLEYGPGYVGDHYLCSHNKLITLKGCTDEIYDNFNCAVNQLKSLEFCPMQVEGYFNCSYNLLTELDRSPFIRKNLFCSGMFKTKPEFNGSCENLFWK